MEAQTCFDLNAAIAKWDQELAAQPGLTPEVRRELKTHLQDSLPQLHDRGLDWEESFWLARRRIGLPRQLNEEFARLDPARVWRERLLWLLLGGFIMPLWSGGSHQLWNLLTSPLTRLLAKSGGQVLPDWVLFYVPFPSAGFFGRLLHGPIAPTLFALLPLVALAVLLARGKMTRAASAIQSVFQSRGRFAFIAGILFLIYGSWILTWILKYSIRQPANPAFPSFSFVLQAVLAQTIWAATLFGLIAWLLPKSSQAKQA